MQDASIIAQFNGKAQDKSSDTHQRTNKRSSRRKPCHVYVPASFDPAKTLPPELRKHADAARYFLHRIIWSDIQKQRTLEKFVPLKFDYLREVIPDRVIRPLKEALIEEGVVECDGQYIEGKKSFGYRLGEDYRSDRIIRIELADGKTADKVRKNRRAEYKKVRLDVHRWLRTQFKRLDVDLVGALDSLAGHPQFEIVKIPVEQMANKDVELNVCRYGRVHTPLTRCSKRVRGFLRVNGESLVGLDIKNSQPLFLALLVMNYRRRGNKIFGYITFPKETTNPYRDIDEIIKNTISTFTQNEENSSSSSSCVAITTRKASEENTELPRTTPLTTTPKTPQVAPVNNDHLQGDELLFLGLCERGELYEHLCCHEEFPVRKWVKEEFFEVIFGKTRAPSSMKTLFTEDFPNVAEVVRVLKRKDYRHLPWLLQNIEANFIINTVCRRIMNELPDAPVFTIHDSILTTESFLEPIRTILIEEFARLGLTPSLHDEDYSKDGRSNPQKPSASP